MTQVRNSRHVRRWFQNYIVLLVVFLLVAALVALVTWSVIRRPTGTFEVQPRHEPQMRIHLIDVGHGAATLIEFSCAAILIDTGGESNEDFESSTHLMEYLDAFFARRVDLRRTLAMLMLTHPHIDHTRSAMEVWGRFTVQNVVTNGQLISSGGPQEEALIDAAARTHVAQRVVRLTDIATLGLHDGILDPVSCSDGDPDIRALWGAADGTRLGWSKRVSRNANNFSVVTKVSLGHASFVVLGDLEYIAIEDLLKKFGSTDVLNADVVEVGHHGSDNATTRELLAAISPKIALISVGAPTRKASWTAWAHGHPRIQTVALLEAALSGPNRPAISTMLATSARVFTPHTVTAPIYATGWDGDVVVTMFANGEIEVYAAGLGDMRDSNAGAAQ